MRLIDADVLKRADFQDFSNTDVFSAIDNTPTAVVRCKECSKRRTRSCAAKHERADNDYCSDGVWYNVRIQPV